MDNMQLVHFPTRNPRNCSRTLPKRSGLTQVFRNCLHYLFVQENSLIYDFHTLFRTANLSLLVRTESPFAPLPLTQTRVKAFTVNASGVGRFGVGCSTGGI